MTDFLFEMIAKAVNFTGTGGMFVLSVTIMTAIFIWCLVLSIKRTDYKFYKRLWAMSLFVAIDVFDYSMEQFATDKISFNLLLVGLSFLYTAILLMIKERKRSGKSGVNFVRRLIRSAEANVESNLPPQDADYMINRAQIISAGKRNARNNKSADSVIKTELVDNSLNSGKSEGEEPDYSHVKSIIERLDTYPLTQVDKYMIESLKKLLLQGENDKSFELQSKINDGLGGLLKIMSRYGV